MNLLKLHPKSLTILITNELANKQVEELIIEYENVCTLRVRMPISSDLSNPRNFITKISRYNKVVNIPNSMTVLDELLPISIEMAKRNCSGIWNFTNPGVISHNEILEMYRDYIDPKFTWVNFNLEEQAKVIVAPRSNNELDASKLKNEFPELLSIKDSIIKYVFEPNKKTWIFIFVAIKEKFVSLSSGDGRWQFYHKVILFIFIFIVIIFFWSVYSLLYFIYLLASFLDNLMSRRAQYIFGLNVTILNGALPIIFF